MAVKLTEELGETKWIDMSERIATMMRERKGLNANVDFYSATVYYSLDIPTDLFTPDFCDFPYERVVGTGSRAVGGQPPLSSVDEVCRGSGTFARSSDLRGARVQEEIFQPSLFQKSGGFFWPTLLRR
jgi:hypothetical protein